MAAGYCSFHLHTFAVSFTRTTCILRSLPPRSHRCCSPRSWWCMDPSQGPTSAANDVWRGVIVGLRGKSHVIVLLLDSKVLQRLFRVVHVVRRNIGAGGTKADVEVLPGDALRVTVRMARPWTFRPGQHAYLYMPTIGLWTNHPFSLAWSEEEEDLNITNMTTDEKGLPMNRQDILEMHKTSMSFIVRRRTGFTERLYKKADLSAAGKFTTTAFVEGPYGKCRTLFPQTFHLHTYCQYTASAARSMLTTLCHRWRGSHLLWDCHAMGSRYWYHSPSAPRS